MNIPTKIRRISKPRSTYVPGQTPDGTRDQKMVRDIQRYYKYRGNLVPLVVVAVPLNMILFIALFASMWNPWIGLLLALFIGYPTFLSPLIGALWLRYRLSEAAFKGFRDDEDSTGKVVKLPHSVKRRWNKVVARRMREDQELAFVSLPDWDKVCVDYMSFDNAYRIEKYLRMRQRGIYSRYTREAIDAADAAIDVALERTLAAMVLQLNEEQKYQIARDRDENNKALTRIREFIGVTHR